MVEEMTHEGIMLCCKNFLFFVNSLPPSDLAKFYPLCLSSNIVETFFSIIRAQHRTFNVYEFASTFHKHVEIFAIQEAGWAVVNYASVGSKRLNNGNRCDESFFCFSIYIMLFLRFLLLCMFIFQCSRN